MPTYCEAWLWWWGNCDLPSSTCTADEIAVNAAAVCEGSCGGRIATAGRRSSSHRLQQRRRWRPRGEEEKCPLPPSPIHSCWLLLLLLLLPSPFYYFEMISNYLYIYTQASLLSEEHEYYMLYFDLGPRGVHPQRRWGHCIKVTSRRSLVYHTIMCSRWSGCFWGETSVLLGWSGSSSSNTVCKTTSSKWDLRGDYCTLLDGMK